MDHRSLPSYPDEIAHHAALTGSDLVQHVVTHAAGRHAVKKSFRGDQIAILMQSRTAHNIISRYGATRRNSTTTNPPRGRKTNFAEPVHLLWIKTFRTGCHTKFAPRMIS
jgi:hypothetical protein